MQKQQRRRKSKMVGSSGSPSQFAGKRGPLSKKSSVFGGTALSEHRKKKRKYELKEGDEILKTFYVDGKKKRTILFRRKEKKELTLEEVEEINNAFRLFDKDNSGSIEVNELQDAMKALGINSSRDGIKKIMEKADKDGSGNIDIEEFTSLMAENIKNRNPEEELKKAFRMYDDDDGGTISFENLKKVS